MNNYMLLISYGSGMRDDVLDIMKKFSVHEYQIIEETVYKPVIGSPRLKNSIWPGDGELAIVIVDENNKINIIDEIKNFNKNCIHDDEHIAAVTLPVAEIIT